MAGCSVFLDLLALGAGGSRLLVLFTVFLRHIPVLARLKWGYPIILAP